MGLFYFILNLPPLTPPQKNMTRQCQMNALPCGVLLQINSEYYGKRQSSLFSVIYVKVQSTFLCKNYTLVATENIVAILALPWTTLLFFSFVVIMEFILWNSCLMVVLDSSEVSRLFIWFYIWSLNKYRVVLLSWKRGSRWNRRTVNDAVYSHLLTNQVIIKSPTQFPVYVNSIVLLITVLFLENVFMKLGHHSECREKAVRFYGTLKVHSVIRTVTKLVCKL